MTHLDLAGHARAIIDANLYLTLGTTDRDGYPWTSAVYFAPAGGRVVLLDVRDRRPTLPSRRRAPTGKHGYLRLHRSAVPRPRGVRSGRGTGGVGERPRPR